LDTGSGSGFDGPQHDVFYDGSSYGLVGAERPITEPQATVLLCDAAESVNGKLYILGAGWSQTLADHPTNMALAIKLLIPWSRANESFTVRASLIDEDSEEAVEVGPGRIMGEASVEVGRRPGLPRGMPLDAAFVFPFPEVRLPQGGYVWIVEINNKEKARIPIQVLSPQKPA
jgi:hypothetical protein